MKIAAAFALVSSFTFAAPAFAESDAERSACTPDVWRLCASEIPNVGAIKLCLQRERPRLSVACRTVMQGSEGPVRTVASRR